MAESEKAALASLDIHPLAGSLGAEVRGLSVRSLSGPAMDALRRALSDYLVLFFPDQHLTCAELKEFGNRWGPLQLGGEAAHVRSADDDEVVELRASQGYVADVWHTDLTPMKAPPLGSILSMKTLPAKGGDTMWSSQYAAYEALSQPIRDVIDNCTAIHSHPRIDETTEHPMVRVNPETGRRALFVNPQYTKRIVQLAPAESEALLQMLYAHSVQPHFTVRRTWKEGDIGIWDNRWTQHYVVNDFVGERVIQRVTIAGEPVEAPVSAYPMYQPGSRSLSARRDSIPAVSEKAA